MLATFRNVAPLLRPGGVYLVEDNEEHFPSLKSSFAWAYTALKSGTTPDELGTRGSADVLVDDDTGGMGPFCAAWDVPRDSLVVVR